MHHYNLLNILYEFQNALIPNVHLPIKHVLRSYHIMWLIKMNKYDHTTKLGEKLDKP